MAEMALTTTVRTNFKSKLTPKRCQMIVDALRIGCPVGTACSGASINRQTFNEWMRVGAELHELWGDEGPPTDHRDYLNFAFYMNVGIAQAESERFAVESINSAMSRDWKAAAEFLKMTAPEKWSPYRIAQRVEVGVSPEFAEGLASLVVVELAA